MKDSTILIPAATAFCTLAVIVILAPYIHTQDAIVTIKEIRGDKCIYDLNGHRDYFEVNCITYDKGMNVTVHKDLFGVWRQAP